MREIKFRAWDKRINKWRPLDKYERLAILESSDFDICQFTGLLDKNGKEIFEGDIVAKGHWRYGLNPHNTKIGVVIYEPPFFCLDKTFIPKPPDDGCNGCAMEISEELTNPISNRGDNILEIIGNIYENPTLLKSEE